MHFYIDCGWLWQKANCCSYQSEINEEHKSINFNLNEGAPIDTNDFNIVHYNINSILAHDKLEQLTANCKLLSIDVLIITESKLDSNIPNNLITIPGYHEPIRHDRVTNGRNGGGVLMNIFGLMLNWKIRHLQ